MRFLSLLIVPILTLIMVLLVIMNFGTPIIINIVSNSMSNLLGLAPMSKTFDLGIFTLLLFILGEASAIFFFLPFMKNVNQKSSAYQRELEKKSISNTENSSRVDVLEAKIKVLEKALEDALNK